MFLLFNGQESDPSTANWDALCVPAPGSQIFPFNITVLLLISTEEVKVTWKLWASLPATINSEINKGLTFCSACKWGIWGCWGLWVSAAVGQTLFPLFIKDLPEEDTSAQDAHFVPLILSLALPLAGFLQCFNCYPTSRKLNSWDDDSLTRPWINIMNKWITWSVCSKTLTHILET